MSISSVGAGGAEGRASVALRSTNLGEVGGAAARGEAAGESRSRTLRTRSRSPTMASWRRSWSEVGRGAAWVADDSSVGESCRSDR